MNQQIQEVLIENPAIHAIFSQEVASTPFGTIIISIKVKDGASLTQTIQVVRQTRIKYGSQPKEKTLQSALIKDINHQAHLDISKKIKAKKEGQLTITAKVNNGTVVDLTFTENFTVKDYIKQ